MNTAVVEWFTRISFLRAGSAAARSIGVVVGALIEAPARIALGMGTPLLVLSSLSHPAFRVNPSSDLEERLEELNPGCLLSPLDHCFAFQVLT